MLILPAIDIRGGQCVRLKQGDYRQETIFGSDPAAMAQRWAQQGAQFLHIVDLDGAREGRPVNADSVRRIVETVSIPCQIGGGFRNDRDIIGAFDWGVKRVVLGTMALQDPAWLEKLCNRFPSQIVLGIDAKQGKAAIGGWQEVSDRSALDLARQSVGLQLAALVFTDIGRDGMLQGPNLDVLAEVVSLGTAPVIASGGITTLDDVRNLARLGLSGCIIGRALYEGALELPAAIAIGNSM